MQGNIEQLRKDVSEAGFRPAPFAKLVWFVRRILWPFIRQYHFYQLEKLLQLAAELRDVVTAQAELQESLHGMSSEVVTARAEVQAEMGKLTVTHTELCSDL